MKILWVKTGKLVPVDTGGKIRSYNILRKLAGRHEVTFLSYYGGRRDEAYEREVCEHLPGTKLVYTATRDATDARTQPPLFAPAAAERAVRRHQVPLARGAAVARPVAE